MAQTSDPEATMLLLRGTLHEIANVATVVQGAAFVLQDGASAAELPELAEDLSAASAELIDLLARVRSSAQLRMVRAQPVPIEDWVQAALAEVPGLRSSLQLAPGSVASVRCDVGMLRDALREVLLNAREAYADPAAAVVRIEARVEDGFFELSVQDDGEGMSAEVLANAAKPFFSTRPRARAGLGLTACAGIVAQHGGELLLSSQLGSGTCVRLRFPAAGT